MAWSLHQERDRDPTRTNRETSMTPADVVKFIKEKEARYCDLRFTDTRGKEQHVDHPDADGGRGLLRRRQDVRRLVDRRLEGHQRVRHDPDAGSRRTAMIDPFFEETTLLLRCDIIEPTTMQGYERDPRSLAKRAEAYLKSTGIADTACSVPRTNSSSSTTCAGPTRCTAAATTSIPRRARGTPAPTTKAATWAIGRA